MTRRSESRQHGAFWRRALWLSALAAVVAATGCTKAQRPELPVPVEISIAASERLNPTEQGRPSPVVLRVFELSGRNFFQTADFFTLLGERAGIKDEEVIDVHEFVMMPGEVRVLRRKTELGTRLIGVVAGYRDAQGGVWRAVATVPPPHKAGRLWSGEASPERKYRVVVGEKAVAIDDVSK